MQKFKSCLLRQVKGGYGYWLVSKSDPQFIICRLSTRDERQHLIVQKWTELHGVVWDFFKGQGLPDELAYAELRLFFQTNFAGKDAICDSGRDEASVPKVDE